MFRYSYIILRELTSFASKSYELSKLQNKIQQYVAMVTFWKNVLVLHTSMYEYMERPVRNIYQIQITVHVHNDQTHVTVTTENLKISQCCDLLRYIMYKRQTSVPSPESVSKSTSQKDWQIQISAHFGNDKKEVDNYFSVSKIWYTAYKYISTFISIPTNAHRISTKSILKLLRHVSVFLHHPQGAYKFCQQKL